MRAVGCSNDPTHRLFAYLDGYVEERREFHNGDRGWDIKQSLQLIELDGGNFTDALVLSFTQFSPPNDIANNHGMVILPEGTDSELLEATMYMSSSQYKARLLELSELTGLSLDQLSQLGDIERLQRLARIAANPAIYFASEGLSLTDAALAIDPSTGDLMMEVVVDNQKYTITITMSPEGPTATETMKSGGSNGNYQV